MSKWSSYKKDQLIMESWKNFLNEAVVGDFKATGGRSLQRGSVPGLTKDQYSERVFGADGVKVLNLIPTATELIKPYNADKELQKLADSIEKLNDDYEEYSRITGNMLNSDPSEQVRTLLGLKKPKYNSEIKKDFLLQILFFANYISLFKKYIPEAAKKGASKPLEDVLKKVSGLVVDSFPDSQSLIDKLTYSNKQAINAIRARRRDYRLKAFDELSRTEEDNILNYIKANFGFKDKAKFINIFTDDQFTEKGYFRQLRGYAKSPNPVRNYMASYAIQRLIAYYVSIQYTVSNDVDAQIMDNIDVLDKLTPMDK